MKQYQDLNDYEIMYLVEENDENAHTILYSKYKPIICSIANKYFKISKKYGLEFDDLIQEGYIGLNLAVKNFNEVNNTKFYTYAVTCIENRISNIIRSHNRKKDYCLNNSISLSTPLYDDIVLLDCLVDNRCLLPEDILINYEDYNSIKNFIFSLDLENACIVELKLNGFKNNDIHMLLNLTLKNVSNRIFYIKRKYRSILDDLKCNFML